MLRQPENGFDYGQLAVLMTFNCDKRQWLSEHEHQSQEILGNSTGSLWF
jgi:hypothetical protein